MTGFHSYYWKNTTLTGPLASALETLSTPTADPQLRERAFRVLLRSDEAAARGIALDRFSMYHAQGRHTDAMQAFLDEVHDEVRHGSPPVGGSLPDDAESAPFQKSRRPPKESTTNGRLAS